MHEDYQLAYSQHTYFPTVRTASGVVTHPTQPGSYHSASDDLKQLGEVAGYRHQIHFYCFRRWVANEANRK
jgi:hypothetical protein